MKKILILPALFISSIGAYSQVFNFTFAGTGACPTQGNVSNVTPANASIVAPARFGGVNCSAAADCFNSSAWSLLTSIDVNKYIEVMVTANAGYQVNAASLTFTTQRSASGPAFSRVALDDGSGSFSITQDFTASSSSSTTINFDFADFSSASGGSVKFRIYGWGATSTSGTLRIDDLNLYGAITSASGGSGATPFTFDMPNNLVGLGKTPTQKFDVNGNIRTSGKLFIGAIDDTKVQALSSYSLAVNGEALFTRARVLLLSAWPDYVFEKEYKLMSLPDLEKYITTHRHLPGVQPAADAEKNGIDVAATQAILLQKLEEMSLYLIEQNKKIEALQKQNEQLQKRIATVENK